jgi:hypothetical protein
MVPEKNTKTIPIPITLSMTSQTRFFHSQKKSCLPCKYHLPAARKIERIPAQRMSPTFIIVLESISEIKEIPIQNTIPTQRLKNHRY